MTRIDPAALREIPEGWALVPVEPTPEMLRDGAAMAQDFYTEKGLYPRSQAVWKAMLAAAPKVRP